MLLGNLNQTPPEWAPELLRTLLAFMAATDFQAAAPGRMLLPGIPEADAYCSVERYATRPARAGLPEAHRRFADVHLVVQGEEFIGWAPLRPGLTVATVYDPAADFECFAQAPGERFIRLGAGDYLVADTGDVHRPRCCGEAAGTVLKVVGKLRSDLLKRPA